MKLSPWVLRKLEQFINGEDEVMPTKCGKDLIALFNAVGTKDVYEQGMPEGLSRTQYTRKQLTEINGTIKLQNRLELLVSPAWFDVQMPIAAAIKKMNTVLMMDGFRFEEIDILIK
ncbi:hypothetical protein [Chitinophaga sp. LS1]|uniref:hypothetical protein n=1 Tax=Chitinophaga sp. LS1 TaxID=3051176 RepID=UPI002AAC20BD|nr:hypothetical protein [Chitinophaga sp. LS1]WPV68153.1 hypothetical protein QQL36_05385 [Chitinophaga sp. LS1]